MTLLTKLYLLTIIITVAVGLWRFKSHSRAIKLLLILLAVDFVFEIIERIFVVKWHNNMPLYHLYAPLEYLFWTLIYRTLLTGSLKRIITFAIVPIILLTALNSIFVQTIYEFPSNVVLFFEIVYLCYSLLGFRQMLLHPAKAALHKQSFFWLNLSLIFFSTTLFLYFGLLNYAVARHLNLNPLQLYVNLINVIYVILLLIAVIKDKIRPKLLKLNESY